MNPGLQTVLQTLLERKIVCMINYIEQRTLKEEKNFTNYANPIKTIQPTFPEEVKSLILRIYLERIRKTH